MILLTSVVYQIDSVEKHNNKTIKSFSKGDLIQFETELKEQLESSTPGKFLAIYVNWHNLTKKCSASMTMNASVKNLNKYFKISEADIGLVASTLEDSDG